MISTVCVKSQLNVFLVIDKYLLVFYDIIHDFYLVIFLVYISNDFQWHMFQLTKLMHDITN